MKRLVFKAVAVALVACSAAFATTLVALDVPGLTLASDTVVRGTVVSVEPHWSGDHARIFTDAEIRVTEVLKGSPSLTTLTAMQPGGEIGEVGQRIHGVATFKPGEDVILFLERRGPRFTVTGMTQGKFHIEPGTLVAHTSPDRDLALIDPNTHAATARPQVSMPLAELKALILANVPKLPAESTTPPKIPAKVSP